jgi:putative transposase
LESEKEKTHPKTETKKENENRGSAVPLHEKGYPLKLGALFS